MTSWSFSSVKQFKNCPRQYHEIRVLKNFKEVQGEANLWGQRVHAAFEDGLKNGAPLPSGMEVWQPVLEQFRGLQGELFVEKEMCITAGFQPCGWWDKTVWCRGKLDALWVDGEVAKVCDWKLGRRRFDLDQLRLFALLVFANYPAVQRVNTMFVWLKEGKTDVEKFERSQVAEMWQPFLLDVKRIEAAHQSGMWPPRTSGLCGGGWCAVKSCEFNGKTRNW